MRDHYMLDPGQIDLEAANIFSEDIFPAKRIEKNVSNQKGNAPSQSFPISFC